MGASATDRPNPPRWNDSVVIHVGFGLLNGLPENGPANRPIPGLAETYEPKDGARTWVFPLRGGVAFHNGKEFDADDAVRSPNLQRGDGRSGAAGPMKAVADVRKTGPREIEVTPNGRDADFPTVLTDCHALTAPNGGADRSKTVGAGPFKVGRFDPGVRVGLKRAGSQRKEGRGHLDAVEVDVGGGGSTRVKAPVSGQVDAVTRAIKNLASPSVARFFEVDDRADAAS